MFIERVTHEIGKGRRVRVATSDGMEQVIIPVSYTHLDVYKRQAVARADQEHPAVSGLRYHPAYGTVHPGHHQSGIHAVLPLSLIHI